MKQQHTHSSPPAPVPEKVSSAVAVPQTGQSHDISPHRREAHEREQTAEATKGHAQTIPGFVADALKRTDAAQGFKLDHVLARYRKEQGFSAEIAQDHLREMIRFLSLSATATQHGKYYGMTGAVDELWHTFVIFTRDYAAFCETVAGRFLHHVPEADGQMSEDTLDHYLTFLDDYEAVYQEPAPAAYWPRPSGLHAEAACKGCSACSGCSGHSCTVH
jgi:hypothetical protein